MSLSTENPVNATRAAAELGLGASYITAIKQAMGITGRYFFLSDVRKFLRTHRDFTLRTRVNLVDGEAETAKNSKTKPNQPNPTKLNLDPAIMQSEPNPIQAKAESTSTTNIAANPAGTDADHELLDPLTARVRSCKTYLGRAVLRLMAKRHLNARDVSSFTKAGGREVSNSYLSRLCRGHQAYISPEHLEILVSVLAVNSHEKAELAQARLLDELPPWARGLIDIRIATDIPDIGGAPDSPA